MKTRFHGLLLSVLLASGSLGPLARGDGPQWVEVRSPHFSVVTDAGEKRGREVALRFEQMRAVFAALMTKANVNIPVPLQIVAFRNTKEMREFAPLWQGKPTQLAGLFQSGEDRSFIMLDVSVENPWTVVFHEYAHQLMNGILTYQMDAWFEEGFAEYFSTIEVDNKEAHVGKPSTEAVLMLDRNGMMKIADLFRVRQYSQTYNETGDRRTTFYAESNLLVHYLYDNNLIPKIGVYFDLKTNKNLPVEEAIEQAFGMSAAQFDKVLHDYVNGNRFRYMILPTPANIAGTGYTVAPMSAADSSAVLADIHLHSRDYQDKAIAEFQAILKTDANHAAALRGLGYAFLQKKQFNEAGDYFRRAAQFDSKDPRVHYYSALLMSLNGGFANRSNLPEMIKELDAAIFLDPTFADSYMLLAFAQTYNGDRAKGLETMQKAVSLSPRNEGYQYNLAQMYMTNRQPDPAIAILQGMTKTANQALALRAGESLRQAQLMKETMEGRAPQQGTMPVLSRRTKETEPGESSDKSEEEEQPAPAKEPSPQPPKNPVPIKFLQGTMTGVDCSAAPAAVLTVVAGSQTWKMKVADTGRVVVFGADAFSCSWGKQRVAINYRETGSGEGSVVSLEIK